MPALLPKRWPMFWEELRRRLRGDRGFLVQFAFAAVLMVLLVGAAQLAHLNNFQPREWANFGSGVWRTLLLVQLAAMVLLTPGLTAGAFSTEREQGTLEQLFLTPMSTLAMVTGKFLGALGQLLVLVLSTMPVVGVVFFYGGVSPQEVAVGYALVLATGIFYATLGFLASCLFSRVTVAVAWAYGFMLMVLLGLPLLVIVLSAIDFLPVVMFDSDAMWVVFANPFIAYFAGEQANLGTGIVVMLIESLVVLFLASFRIHRLRGATTLLPRRLSPDKARQQSGMVG